ncbi:phosphopentomutase [Acidaminobacter sp. JC074]|uniref:phosphopentomutase n=1 Tax=Acidaminobacter sp. JC074 TaxID=2530199 RepID=UPI001F0FE8CD|nr:phosphopentomutase [Acidaminobacter sp. JC074]MCH4888834.1 phosphopentomutase [Acidaminobacter sp. JC074]
MNKRVILMILDSLGVGALPDSEKYGDVGVNTLNNIAKNVDRFEIPNLIKMGIGNLEGITHVPSSDDVIGAYGRSMEVSNGKDTTMGHWEIAGLNISEPFNTYPDGFPEEIIKPFEEKTGRKVVCNAPASGTVVIDEFGKHHMETGDLIVYTSADSVFQIAAHEEIVPIDELYKYCEIAREMLMGKHQVARVIARPFVGTPGNFTRTSNRHDYSLKPFDKTVLDQLKEAGKDVIAVGKIVDIFDGEGITESVHTKSNMDGVDKTLEYMKADNHGLIFSNLVDFDAMFGHRRNIEGYRDAIEEFDKRLPEIQAAMKPGDILMLAADHGNDPSYTGTDHTREYIPMLVFGDAIKAGTDLGTRKSFADIAATIAEVLEIDAPKNGESFFGIMKKEG